MSTAAHGGQIWFELYVTDLQRARDFYQRLLGWSFAPFLKYDPEHYLLATPPSADRPKGALVQRGSVPSQAPEDSAAQPSRSAWTTVPYFEVADLELAMYTARALGSALLVAPHPIHQEGGFFAVVTDTEGNHVGLWAEQYDGPAATGGPATTTP